MKIKLLLIKGFVSIIIVSNMVIAKTDFSDVDLPTDINYTNEELIKVGLGGRESLKDFIAMALEFEYNLGLLDGLSQGNPEKKNSYRDMLSFDPNLSNFVYYKYNKELKDPALKQIFYRLEQQMERSYREGSSEGKKLNNEKANQNSMNYLINVFPGIKNKYKFVYFK